MRNTWVSWVAHTPAGTASILQGSMGFSVHDLRADEEMPIASQETALARFVLAVMDLEQCPLTGPSAQGGVLATEGELGQSLGAPCLSSSLLTKMKVANEMRQISNATIKFLMVNCTF